MIDGSGCFLPESKRAFPSVWVSFWKMLGMASLFPKSKIFNRYALGNLSKDEVHEVDVLAGAFMMVRKKVADVLNGFDEDFFMYGEDIDLSWRIKKAGYKNYYLGNLRIIHFKGESTLQNHFKHVKRFYGAMHVFADKHYKAIHSFFLKAAIAIAAMVSAITIPFRNIKNKFKTSSTTKNKIICIGDEKECEVIRKIMSNHEKNDFQQMDMSKIKNIKEAQIIFCTGTILYTDAIEFIYKNPSINFYGWHGSNTKSIVISNNKNSTGIAYT